MNRAHGVDLSHWDGSFDPAKASGRIGFAIMKVSEGLVKDPAFAAIWSGVEKVTVRGAYHYLRSGWDWKLQADTFWNIVQDYPFNLYALDFEGIGNVTSAKFANMAHLWMDYIQEKAAGRPVLLYTNPSHYDADLYPYGDWMKNYPLWLAQYWSNPEPDLRQPGLPINRKAGDWKVWQYASEINDNGNGKNMKYGTDSKSVDLNVFNGTVADMCTWLAETSPPAVTLFELVQAQNEAAIRRDELKRMAAYIENREAQLGG
jgi:GH25 family lysozyme M1 (1,4-beta-N-acetylmuramidase)